ncbi:MAG: 2-succinyl-6-hydroxy-2,4-cyclohexadiene-1-carboxylate synthase [Aggregatilineales bacterium]
MTRISINNMTYAVERTGNGTPIVLLHGFTGSKANWRHLIPTLAQAHTVITIDLPGHGDTDKPDDPHRYRMEYVSSDVVKLICAMTTSPIALLGYSMGGRLAIYIAAHYPHEINRLILESASPGLLTEEQRLQRQQSDEQLAERIERDGITSFVDYWENIALFASQKSLPESTQRELHEQRLNNSPTGLANSLRGMGTGIQPTLWGKLSAIHQPTLLITGELDTKFHAIAHQMKKEMPDAQHISVPRAGHTIHLEQPDAYYQHVLEFCDSES